MADEYVRPSDTEIRLNANARTIHPIQGGGFLHAGRVVIDDGPSQVDLSPACPLETISKDQDGNPMYGWGYSGTGSVEFAHAILQLLGLDHRQHTSISTAVENFISTNIQKTKRWQIELPRFADWVVEAMNDASQGLDIKPVPADMVLPYAPQVKFELL